MSDVDVLVIGAGPAGAIAATLLNRLGHSVEIWEQSEFPRHRIGESLPPRAVGLIEHLQLGHALNPEFCARMTGNTVVWNAPEVRRTVFPDGWGVQVERSRFDAALLEEVRHRVRFGRRCLAITDGPDGAPIARSDEGEVRAGFVVLACGVRSALVRQRSRRQVDLRQWAIYGYFRDALHPDGDQANDTVIESFEDGWVWSLRLASGLRNVTVLLGAGYRIPGAEGVRRLYRDVLRTTPFTGGLVAAASLDGGLHVCDASWIRTDVPQMNRVFLTGDAASVIDQLSSQGVYKSICSGMSAAAAIHTSIRFPERRALAEEYFAAEETRARAGYAAGAVAAYRLEQRWPDRPFWAERHRLNRWDHLLNPPGPDAGRERLARAIEDGSETAVLRVAPGVRVEPRPVLHGHVIEPVDCVVSSRNPSGYGGASADRLRAALDAVAQGRVPPRSLTAYMVREGLLEPL